MELCLNNIVKQYSRDVKALDGISHTFTSGVYGLLGPNGAGKSTMIKLITDDIRPTSGTITLDGVNIWDMKEKYRSTLGYMPQQQDVYPSMTLERFMYYIAALKGLSRQEADAQISELTDAVNLADDRKRRLGTFSGGMKQRALIAQAMLGNPGIIVMDEPTAGLDPRERIRMRNLIAELAGTRIIIIATHVVSDIEFIAREILVLNHGHLIAADEPENLCDEMQGKVWEALLTEKEADAVSSRYMISSMNRTSEGVRMRAVTPERPGETWREVSPDLEDLYLYLFGE